MNGGTPRQVSPDLPTILLVNPVSRRGTVQFARFRDALHASLNLVDAALTASADDMAQRIRQGLNTQIIRFVIGGGDGTLSRAADLLANTTGILGVLPLGTGNTFSHGLGLPSSREALVSLLAEGPLARYDVGLAEKEQHTKVFLNSLTMGFSERIVELLERETKERLGYAAWILEFRRALTMTPTLTIHLSWPGGEDHFLTRQLVVVNGRTIAASISATPESSAQDGLLEVFRLGGPALFSIIRLGTKLLMGQLLTDQQSHYQALTDLTFSADPALPVNIDGDLWHAPPLRCRVLPGALRVISPSASGQSPRRWPLVTRALGSPRIVLPHVGSYSAQKDPGRS